GLRRYLEARGHRIDIFMKRPPPNPLEFDRVIIWNGGPPKARRLARRCASLGVPTAFLEVGFFPQREYSMLSRCGSVGGGLLRGEELPTIGKTEEEFLQKAFAAYSRGAAPARRGHIAGFLQFT